MAKEEMIEFVGVVSEVLRNAVVERHAEHRVPHHFHDEAEHLDRFFLCHSCSLQEVARRRRGRISAVRAIGKENRAGFDPRTDSAYK